MQKRWTAATAACFGLLALALPTAADASLVLVDDFETGYTLNANINGQNGWVQGTGEARPPTLSAVVTDPADPNNKVLKVSGRDNITFLPTRVPLIEDGHHGTFFTRFRFETADGNPDASFGLIWADDILSGDPPNPFDAFATQVRQTTNFNARNYGGFARLDTDQAPLLADTWYSLWMVVNNDVRDNSGNEFSENYDVFDIFIQADSGPYAAQTELDPSSNDTIFFRRAYRLFDSTTVGLSLSEQPPILGVGILMGNDATDTDALYLDDIYVDGSNNTFENPTIPEPATLGLAAIGLGFVASRNRR